MEYFYLNEKQQKYFNHFLLLDLFVGAYNILASEVGLFEYVSKQKPEQIFRYLQDNRDICEKLDGFIEKALNFACRFQKEKLEEKLKIPQFLEYFRCFDRQDNLACMAVILIYENLCLLAPSNLLKNFKSANVRAAKSKARQEFKKQYEMSVESLYAAIILFVLQILWQDMCYMGEQEDMALKGVRFKIVNVMPTILRLYSQVTQMLFLAQSGKQQKEAARVGQLAKYNKIKKAYELWCQNVNIYPEDFLKQLQLQHILPVRSIKTLESRYLYHFRNWHKRSFFPSFEEYLKNNYFSQ